MAQSTMLCGSATFGPVAIAVPFVLLRPESVDRWTIALMVVTAVLDNTIKVWMAACTALDRQAMTAVVLVGQRPRELPVGQQAGAEPEQEAQAERQRGVLGQGEQRDGAEPRAEVEPGARPPDGAVGLRAQPLLVLVQ